MSHKNTVLLSEHTVHVSLLTTHGKAGANVVCKMCLLTKIHFLFLILILFQHACYSNSEKHIFISFHHLSFLTPVIFRSITTVGMGCTDITFDFFLLTHITYNYSRVILLARKNSKKITILQQAELPPGQFLPIMKIGIPNPGLYLTQIPTSDGDKYAIILVTKQTRIGFALSTNKLQRMAS